MKNSKYMARLLTLTLTLVMVVTSMGLSVFAEEGVDGQAPQQDAAAAADDAVAEDAAPADEQADAEQVVVEEQAVANDALGAGETVTAPTGVTATAVKQKLANGERQRTKYLNTKNEITVSWTKPSTPVTGYEIFNNKGARVATADAGATSVTFDAPVGKFSYTVKAYNGGASAVSAASNAVKGSAIKIHKNWHWTATMDKNTTLYKKSKGKAAIKTIPKGTKGIILATYPKRPKKWNKPIRVQIQLLDANGKETPVKGWVKYGPISASPNIDTDSDYTRADKEAFANQYTSKTNYLIWVNGYTQRENVFKKSGGKWVLISSNRVTLGNFYQPVSRGHKILKNKKGRVTMLDDKGRPYYFNYARTFGGSGYFHTRSYWSRSGKAKNKVQYRPATKGCIRQYTDDAKFIYGLPKGTKILFM